MNTPSYLYLYDLTIFLNVLVLSLFQTELSTEFGIRGIPTLIILDKDGGTVTPNGRGQVTSPKKKFDFVKE